MKKIHTGVTVWCIFNIGLGLLLTVIAIAVGVKDTTLMILVFLTILFYALALIPNAFAMVAIIILGIISEFYGGMREYGTWGLIFDILWLFIDFMIFFILKYNGKTAFQASREKNYNLPTENTIDRVKKCPFCANEIKFEAIVCQYCGRDLPKQGE